MLMAQGDKKREAVTDSMGLGMHLAGVICAAAVLEDVEDLRDRFLGVFLE